MTFSIFTPPPYIQLPLPPFHPYPHPRPLGPLPKSPGTSAPALSASLRLRNDRKDGRKGDNYSSGFSGSRGNRNSILQCILDILHCQVPTLNSSRSATQHMYPTKLRALVYDFLPQLKKLIRGGGGGGESDARSVVPEKSSDARSVVPDESSDGVPYRSITMLGVWYPTSAAMGYPTRVAMLGVWYPTRVK